MIVELITTGSELLLGRVLNTHSQWIGTRMAELGMPLSRHVTVPDTAEAICGAVQTALSQSDLVITTGGLGPTSDDITRERIAGLLGTRLVFHPEVEAAIRAFFESRRRPMPEKTRVEAWVPEGATYFLNQHGTAPGLAFDLSPNPFRSGGGRSGLILLPGPPRELHPMFDEQVRPWIGSRWGAAEGFVTKTYKTTGLGESLMEGRLEGHLAPLIADGLQVGYCARVGEVDVRFSAAGSTASQLLRAAAEILFREAGEFVFGEGEDSLEQVLVRTLTQRSQTLALAESCTGGHLANRITNVPGASAVLLAGVVSYANAAKTTLLGVSEALLAEHGAVSEPVARAMAEGARRVTGADYALSTTGIAGPGGGTEEKPVGTVFIAIAGPHGTTVRKQLNRFDRQTFKYSTAQQAFNQLRLALATAPSAGSR